MKEIAIKFTLINSLIIKQMLIMKEDRFGKKPIRKLFKFKLKYLSQIKSENHINMTSEIKTKLIYHFNNLFLRQI